MRFNCRAPAISPRTAAKRSRPTTNSERPDRLLGPIGRRTQLGHLEMLAFGSFVSSPIGDLIVLPASRPARRPLGS